MRGGSHNGTASEKFLVENDVRSITLTLIGDRKLDRLTLTNPAGKSREVKVTSARDEEGVFRGAWMHTAVVKKPEQGEWRVEAAAGQPGSYLLTVNFDSDLSRSLKLKPQERKICF